MDWWNTIPSAIPNNRIAFIGERGLCWAYPGRFQKKSQGLRPGPKGQKHKDQSYKAPDDAKTVAEVGNIWVNPETASRHQEQRFVEPTNRPEPELTPRSWASSLALYDIRNLNQIAVWRKNFDAGGFTST